MDLVVQPSHNLGVVKPKIFGGINFCKERKKQREETLTTLKI